ncbi:MAG: peptidoglycan editing factor PgeF [Gammaproteobacteria bacterium]
MTDAWIVPDWPVPAHVRALSTTRAGGRSRGPYASLNLGDHVGDDPAAVAANRKTLAAAAGLPAEPVWLQQVHGNTVVDIARTHPGSAADAACSHQPGPVCAVLTADCLPVLLCDRAGDHVAAVHAGWRGLAGGVIEQAVAALQAPGGELLAWLGPAISAASYRVGTEVRKAFMAHDPQAQTAFQAAGDDTWHADLYQLARQRLAACGVPAVHGGGRCTFSEAQSFYSYRRDGVTGRMATLIWLAPR